MFPEYSFVFLFFFSVSSSVALYVLSRFKLCFWVAESLHAVHADGNVSLARILTWKLVLIYGLFVLAEGDPYP